MEIQKEAIPLLIDKFYQEQDQDIKVSIIHVIWQHREPNTISFLSDVLTFNTDALWQEALDGLVTIGTMEAILALEKTINLAMSNNNKVIWINEAIEQIKALSD